MRLSRLRVVLDTNVLISAALFPDSTPGQVLDMTGSEIDLMISSETLAELDDVLKRSRFQRYIREVQRLRFLEALEETGILVDVTLSVAACRDPKDDKFLELAVGGSATHIVSGDQDLLDLHPFRGISIVSPRRFLYEVGQCE